MKKTALLNSETLIENYNKVKKERDDLDYINNDLEAKNRDLNYSLDIYKNKYDQIIELLSKLNTQNYVEIIKNIFNICKNEIDKFKQKNEPQHKHDRDRER